jgi:hypothetical protein
MDIIPARRLAPHDFFTRRVKLHEADRTIARDFLALAIDVGRGDAVGWARWCVLEYVAEFG